MNNDVVIEMLGVVLVAMLAVVAYQVFRGVSTSKPAIKIDRLCHYHLMAAIHRVKLAVLVDPPSCDECKKKVRNNESA